MKKIKPLILLLFISSSLFSQTYLTLTPLISNTNGSMMDKTNLSLELGHQWDVFSLGLVGGRTSLAKMKNDTTLYAELRANLNVFKQGDFTNTFTIGAGYMFNAKNYFITELTYTIEYALTKQIHLNILAGQYFYSGLNTMSEETIVGFSLIYFFKPYERNRSVFKVE